jgi:HlyD family secretion protein
MAKKQTITQAIPEIKVEDKEKKKNLSALIAWFKAKKIRWISAILVLALILFILFNVFGGNSNADEEYQTAVVEQGDLIAIVGATGIVEARQTADLNWQTTGRVEHVFVQVNQQVKEGEVLADLADNTLPQSVILAQADLVNARKELDDLANSTTDSSQKYQDLLQAEKEFRTATDDRDQWNYSGAAWERINEARSRFIRLEEELKSAESAFDAVSDLAEEDPSKIEAEQALADAQFARDKALRELNYILGRPYNREVADDFASYDVALSKLQDAEREWQRVKDGPNSEDISAAEARVEAAEATVSLGWLEAPFDGTVTRALPKVGDSVSTGAQGFRIDDLSELFVRVDISEVDINRVNIGQKVELSFDAVTAQTYLGEVTEVSSVGVDSGDGVDFEVTLRIIDPDEQVRPGMTAAVNIIVSEINDVLIVPNRAIRLKDGQRIVYLLKNNRLAEVNVETGASSDTETQITAGELSPGDLVVLNPPSFFQSNGGPPPFVRQ